MIDHSETIPMFNREKINNNYQIDHFSKCRLEIFKLRINS